jgi:enolase
LRAAIEKANYVLVKDFVLAIDAAATEFYQDNQYNLHKEEKLLSTEAMIDFYHSLSLNYPILSFEDPLAEDDWTGFKAFTAKMPNTQVVGDDLYVTNVDRLQRGIKEKSSNSILIKLNQIGTLTETIKAINLAKANNFTTIISHRSGETDDAFIADLAVAMGSGQIKTGAPGRGERTAKYNRLLEIAQELGDRAEYAKFPFQA